MNVAMCRSSWQLKDEDEVVNGCDSGTGGCSIQSCVILSGYSIALPSLQK